MKSIRLSLIAISSLVATTAVEAKQRPNILLICIDDLRQDGDHIGAPEAITPNLDRISSEGRLFTHQYVQAPTSGASRAMMLTGAGAKSGKDVNNFTFSNSLVGSTEDEVPETFIHHLRRNGYHTIGMGKVSHSDNGFNYTQKQKVQELPYSRDEFINDPKSPWEDSFDAMLHGYPNGRIRTKEDNAAFEFLDLPDSCYADSQLADLAVDRLQQIADQQRCGEGEPTFMAVGFYKPHLPFVAPKRYWDLYDGVDIAISPTPNLPEGVDRSLLHPSAECFKQYSHAERGGLGVRLSDDYARDLRRAYLSALSFTDAQVGRVLDRLRETGLDKSTIVIIWGDHGWHLGDHSLWGKHSGFESALNSLLIAKSPTMRRVGERSDELVAAIDIYPTICEYAQIESPDTVEGVSFVDLIERGRTRLCRDYVLSYWNNILSLRTAQYRLALFNNGKHEAMMLFDHYADPTESRSVAAENPEVVSELMARIDQLNRGYLPSR
ncbi:MAG: sulfatase [Rikenellaceae bacterium]